MEHKKFEEWLILSRYGELSVDEQAELEAHLADCGECRRQQRHLMQLHDLLDSKPSEVSLEDVASAREELLRLVRLDRMRQKARSGAGSGWSAPLSMPLRMAASVGLVTIGLGLGYLLFGSAPAVPADTRVENEDPFVSRDIRVSNVSFQEVGDGTDEVELSFDAARPVTLRGRVSDPKVQRLLAYAMVNEQNPGVRLQAASAIQGAPAPDADVRNALIAALQMDTNDGVRTKALQALSSYGADPEVKAALMRVLRFDTNPMLRIEAINMLEGSVAAGAPVDDSLRDVLRDRSEKDDNNYIRLRARAVLQEVGYQ